MKVNEIFILKLFFLIGILNQKLLLELQLEFVIYISSYIIFNFHFLVGTTIGHPLDTIKVKLQTQREYKGVIDCFVKIVKHEGVYT